MLAQAEVLATEQRRIAGQDLLDSIEDRADDEDLAKRIDAIDSKQRLIAQAVDGYLAKMLGFSKTERGRTWTRYGVEQRAPAAADRGSHPGHRDTGIRAALHR